MNGRVGIGIAPIVNHAVDILVLEFAGFFKREILFHSEAMRRGQNFRRVSIAIFDLRGVGFSRNYSTNTAPSKAAARIRRARKI